MTRAHLICFATISSVPTGTEYKPDAENQEANAGYLSLSSHLSLRLWECYSGMELPCGQAELAPLLELTQPIPKGNFQLFLCGARAGSEQSTREGLL